MSPSCNPGYRVIVLCFGAVNFLYMGTRLPILPRKSNKILLSNPVIFMSY